MAEPAISARLADFVVGSRWEDIPGPVRAHAVRAILNGVGTALGGSSDQAVLRLFETLKPFSASQSATIIGQDTRVDAPTAAFVNAVSVNVFDFDDNHHTTIIHPTAPIAPAILALAEQQPVSGAQALHAFVLGVEVACRIGNAVSPGHYARGWHITATCGIFGAAAAVGKLIGLDRRQMLWALGNASAQASGLVEALGYMAKSVGVGNAARNGFLSALMARAGVEGPPYPLEGERGFLKVTCDSPDPSAIVDGLGQHWEFLRNTFKPYPCGIVLNPVIDACLEIRAIPGFAPDAVETITVAGNPLLKARADRPWAESGREAQVIGQHAIAVSLLRGTAGVADFSDEAVADPQIRAFREKVVSVDVDSAIPVQAASLRIRLRGDDYLDRRVDTARGSLARQMTDADLVAKFQALAAYGCPGFDPAPLLERLWSIEDSQDVGAIMGAARPTTQAAR